MNTDGHGLIATKGHKGRKGHRGGKGVAWRVRAASSALDPIAAAFERERQHERMLAPECDTLYDHVFRCVCCGWMRDEREQREPGSLVCQHCARAAGYWN